MNDIYAMKLHDTINTEGNINITRVPGGWVYNYVMRNYTVMVPYNDEFNIVKHEMERKTTIRQMQSRAQMQDLYERQLAQSLRKGV